MRTTHQNVIGSEANCKTDYVFQIMVLVVELMAESPSMKQHHAKESLRSADLN